ncbi:MAG: cytochrome c biogenesis heme-transporting ATPase CcmA [Betaproteobacteria bacterium]|nr:cytochrome c biogenesis heme-transporting ATPase CcmA [Betaproteobacteria bacterium]
MTASAAIGSSIGPLKAERLGVARGPRQLFADLSFEIASGEILVLRGANGSGKTTLLRIVAGLTLPDQGGVQWGGRAWRQKDAERRAVCLYLGHAHALKDELSAMDNLRFALALDGIEAGGEACAHALDACGLEGRHHVEVRRLSQGQKRRVGLARLALSDKPLWLLDEPTNALDAEGIERFCALILEHTAKGGIAAVATHLPMPFSAAREMTLEQAA